MLRMRTMAGAHLMGCLVKRHALRSLSLLESEFVSKFPSDLWCIGNNRFTFSLNISGNDIGPRRGAALMYALAGSAGGDKTVLARLDVSEHGK